MAEYKNLENIKKLLDEEYVRIKNLIFKGETHLDNLAEGFVGADRVIFRLPTADVVEVVRCKECKHSSFIKSCSKYECKKGCGSLKYSNDYCSYGERKCNDD